MNQNEKDNKPERTAIQRGELITETRPCRECIFFIPKNWDIPICSKKHMSVSTDMYVSFYENEGTCFNQKYRTDGK